VVRAEEVGDAARVEWVWRRTRCWAPHLAHWVIPGWLGSGGQGRRRVEAAVKRVLRGERPGEITVAGQRLPVYGDPAAARAVYSAVEGRVMAGEGEVEAFGSVAWGYGLGVCA